MSQVGGRRKRRSRSRHSGPRHVEHTGHKSDKTLKIDEKTGNFQWISPGVETQLKKVKKRREEENKKTVDDYLKNNDLTDLVSPYLYDPVQMNILSYILGRKNVDEIAALNALAYSGIVNTKCPPPGEPDKTEEYVNILTGKKECREPIPKRKQRMVPNSQGELEPLGPTQCPEPGGDPLAIQKYIDFFGKAQCIRPILSGSFSCPPANDPKKTKLVALKNNVGICVEDPTLKPANKKVLMPTQLVYPDDVNAKIADFLKLYSNIRFTSDSIRSLGHVLRSSKSLRDLGDIKRGLSGDPEYEAIAVVLDNIRGAEDISIAKTALVQFAKEKHPGVVYPEGEYAVEGIMEFHGIDPSHFVGGSKRRRR